MIADQYEQLAVKAARIAATSTTQDEANRWWARVAEYETAAEQARATEETP